MPCRSWNRVARRAVVLVALALITPIAFVGAQATGSRGQDKREQVDDIMKAKLRYAQAILKGVATEDFESLAKSSQDLSLLSQEASWNVVQTPEYLQHSIDFRRAADAINKASKEKNLDAATLAYFQMTIRCVDCHRHIRAVRIGEGAPAP
ncbi:MAG: hypothetical protein MPJ50_17525 [Pirellulales bacterium]|nr:hypothetical protein [Pirellulales bacterium]